MKPGQIVKTFKSKSGKEVVLRYPKEDDFDDLLAYINELSSEDTYIRYSGEKITREEEKKFLKSVLENMKKRNKAMILAYVGDELAGNTSIERTSIDTRRSVHRGSFGISIRKKYRGDGVGCTLMQTVLEKAKEELNLQMVTLTVFSNNPIAPSLYKVHGFVEYGKLPEGILYKGEYVDLIYMYKKL